MSLQIGQPAPDFTAQTTMGPISFHEWIGDSWCVLFSHPKDFTPVCTTELGYMARIKPEFDRRNVKIIGLSIDPVDNHAKWAADIAETLQRALPGVAIESWDAPDQPVVVLPPGALVDAARGIRTSGRPA